MTNNFEDLNNQIQAMFDKVEDKEMLEQFGALKSLADKCTAEHNQLKTEQKDLIKDYKELIKHTSFAPNGSEAQQVQEPKDISFEEFLVNFKK